MTQLPSLISAMAWDAQKVCSDGGLVPNLTLTGGITLSDSHDLYRLSFFIEVSIVHEFPMSRTCTL